MIHITSIQRFSIHDGPGIRTTVFLKGCSLHCFWCHNPETIHKERELKFISDRCIGCGECHKACPANTRYNKSDCLQCFVCAEACPAQALIQSSQELTEEELAIELKKDIHYYRQSNGGITFSGGEPLLQSSSIGKLLSFIKQDRIHIAVDTAGNVPWENISQIIDDVDLFLYDIKFSDEKKHKEATGSSNRKVFSNLEQIAKLRKRIWVRIPIIRGWNDSEEEITAIAQRIQEYRCIESVGLLPFHRLGEAKYRQLGRDYPARELSPPDEYRIDELQQVLRRYGLPVSSSTNLSSGGNIP